MDTTQDACGEVPPAKEGQHIRAVEAKVTTCPSPEHSAGDTAPQAAFPIAERDLAIRLGRPFGALKKARARFSEGTDWLPVDRKIRWTRAAAEKLAAHLGVGDEIQAWLNAPRDGDAAPLGARTVSEAAVSEKPAGTPSPLVEWPIIGTVTRVNFPNPMVIELQVDGRRAWLDVKPDWRPWFVPGMKVGLKPNGPRDRYYTRKPRQKGKW